MAVDELPLLMPQAVPRRVLVRAAAMMVAGAVTISFSPVFVKLAGVGPGAAGFWRMAFGGTALLLFAVLTGRLERPPRRAALLTVAAGAFLCGDLICWHASIGYIGPGLSTILVNLQVFVLAGAGLLFFRERLSARLVAAIPLALLGLFLLVGVNWSGFDRTHRVGVVLGVLAGACYGTYLLLLRASQRGRPVSTMTTVVVLSLACAAILGITTPLEGTTLALPDAAAAGWLLAYGLGPQVLGWLLITSALPVIKASRAGLILLLQPALAFIWDMLLFGRVTTGVEVLGAIIALAAIYLGSAPEPRRR